METWIRFVAGWQENIYIILLPINVLLLDYRLMFLGVCFCPQSIFFGGCGRAGVVWLLFKGSICDGKQTWKTRNDFFEAHGCRHCTELWLTPTLRKMTFTHACKIRVQPRRPFAFPLPVLLRWVAPSDTQDGPSQEWVDSTQNLRESFLKVCGCSSLGLWFEVECLSRLSVLTLRYRLFLECFIVLALSCHCRWKPNISLILLLHNKRFEINNGGLLLWRAYRN